MGQATMTISPNLVLPSNEQKIRDLMSRDHALRRRMKPNTSRLTQDQIRCFGWVRLNHLAYNPDLGILSSLCIESNTPGTSVPNQC
ncbi:hypothetical protein NPIL_241571 [Nephila pilipes]|uniref:Uncharacterized protein n=1 Tax=Nephila pilipes TaxID=299642 RepID=A0A8X6NPS9_NEPPI|nr:hypothetical protein NPIL_241571 [Nephila pilipes]